MDKWFWSIVCQAIALLQVLKLGFIQQQNLLLRPFLKVKSQKKIEWWGKDKPISKYFIMFVLGGIQQLRGPNFDQFWPPLHLEWTSMDILHTPLPPCPQKVDKISPFPP